MSRSRRNTSSVRWNGPGHQPFGHISQDLNSVSFYEVAALADAFKTSWVPTMNPNQDEIIVQSEKQTSTITCPDMIPNTHPYVSWVKRGRTLFGRQGLRCRG